MAKSDLQSAGVDGLSVVGSHRWSAVRRRLSISNWSPSKTRQSAKDECDVNKIIERFRVTGQLPNNTRGPGQFGDFTALTSYQDSLNIVLDAQSRFDALSAPLRARFNNDPALFVAFANNPQNASEMVKLGLATARPQVAPTGQPDGANKAPSKPSPASSSPEKGESK